MGSSRRRHRFQTSELVEALVNHPAQESENDGFITRSLAIRGELVAETDLWMNGQMEGNIIDPNYQVTVEEAGLVVGEVCARIVIVEGKIIGDVHASESVTLRGSANVQGKILAPQVVIEKGAKFNGNVQMDVAPMLATSTRS